MFLSQNVLETIAPYAVVFEDDAVIGANFSRELKVRLERLPANWDILFLNGCYKKFGYIFEDGLRQSRGGLCTYAYVISMKGARYLLSHAVVHSDKPIDHVLDYETLTGHLLSFHADPPLAHVSSTKASTLHTNQTLNLVLLSSSQVSGSARKNVTSTLPTVEGNRAAHAEKHIMKWHSCRTNIFYFFTNLKCRSSRNWKRKTTNVWY